MKKKKKNLNEAIAETQELQTQTVKIHIHKNPDWGEELQAYTEAVDGSQAEVLGCAVEEDVGGWYTVNVDVKGNLKEQKNKFKLVICGEENPEKAMDAPKLGRAEAYRQKRLEKERLLEEKIQSRPVDEKTLAKLEARRQKWLEKEKLLEEKDKQRLEKEKLREENRLKKEDEAHRQKRLEKQRLLEEKNQKRLENEYKVTRIITSDKELWLAKDGKAKKDVSAVNNYEENHFVWNEHDSATKASLFVLGVSHLKNKRYVEGVLLLLVEIAFFVFMGLYGVKSIINMITLGTNVQERYQDDEGYWQTREGDNSMTMLLSGVITIVVIAMFALFYLFAFRSNLRLAAAVKKNRKYSFREVIKSFANDKLYILMLIIPLAGVLVFTIIPLVYMILIAFTNYDHDHQPPGQLFDWVGFKNFLYLFGQDANFATTFWKLFLWTLIWAFFSTFTCFFGGMGLAMLIKNNRVKGKVIFRTIFVLTIAIPSFISLLSIQTMLQERGVINEMLMKYGFISDPLPFLTNKTWARITVIVVNLWIGVPISMLITTGILLNIPADLFESARMDGAGPFVIFRKIIMPYIMYVCTPYLINAFIANINNFNVIYFLTGGGPDSLENFKGAGGTDLLVTWLYKLTVDNRDYSYASAIGIMIFLISAVLSLIVLRRSSSFKNEGSF